MNNDLLMKLDVKQKCAQGAGRSGDLGGVKRPNAQGQG